MHGCLFLICFFIYFSAAGELNYLVTAPSTFFVGRTETISVEVFSASSVKDKLVSVQLVSATNIIVLASGQAVLNAEGRASVTLTVPDTFDASNGNSYRLRILVDNGAVVDAIGGPISIQPAPDNIFVQSDKPLYQPGQTVHLQVIALDAFSLKPLSQKELVISVHNAKDNLVARWTRTTNSYGTFFVELPTPSDAPLGTWEVAVHDGDALASGMSFEMAEYTLPTFEVTLMLDTVFLSQYVQGDDGTFKANSDTPSLHGRVHANYTFGKPVQGTVQLSVWRQGWYYQYPGDPPMMDGPAWDGGAPYYAGSTGTTQSGELLYVYPAAKLDKEGDYEFTLDLTKLVQQGDLVGLWSLGSLVVMAAVTDTAGSQTANDTAHIELSTWPVQVTAMFESAFVKPGLPTAVSISLSSLEGAPLSGRTLITRLAGSTTNSTFSQQYTLTTTADGIARQVVDIPANTSYVTLEAWLPVADTSTSYNAAAYAYSQVASSPTSSFVSVVAQSVTIGRAAVAIGQVVVFDLYSTQPAGTPFHYQVLSRANILQSGTVVTSTLNVSITAAMAPRATLVVYQVTGDGEVVVDSVDIAVVEDLGTVDIDTGLTGSLLPGQPITLHITSTSAGPSALTLMGVDEGVLLLRPSNWITVSRVIERLLELIDSACQHPYYYYYYSGPPAGAVFSLSGMAIITNLTVPTTTRSGYGGYEGGVMAAAAMATGGMPPPEADGPGEGGPANSPVSGPARATRTRRFFPETWLWNYQESANGQFAVPSTAPDSITTWRVAGLVLDQENGLTVGTASVRVFQPFFAILNAPYSVIRGEVVPLSIGVFNYLAEPLSVKLTLLASDEYEIVSPKDKRAPSPSGDNADSFYLQPQSAENVAVYIRPTVIGEIALRLVLTTQDNAVSDSLQKLLLVRPEGELHAEVTSMMVYRNSSNAPPQVLNVSLRPPSNSSYVEGSARATVTVVGNIMGRDLDTLDSLIQMPYGCGEQTMLSFAPSVYVAAYLKDAGKFTGAAVAKAEKAIIAGYQRELTFQRSDGSFSAFGESDNIGSLFLTAFVVRTFSHAAAFVAVDETVMQRAGAWILKQQNVAEGYFPKVGFIHDTQLLGGLQGDDSAKIPLTAYVTVALLDAMNAGVVDLETQTAIRAAISKAINFLEAAQLGRSLDCYSAALSAYALQLAGSAAAHEAVDMLISSAVVTEDGMYWTCDTRTDKNYWSSAADIEVTSYGLLAIITRDAEGDFGRAMQIVRWLSKQRSAFAGWRSTQDTVVAMQALSSVSFTATEDLSIALQSFSGAQYDAVYVNAENADIFQSFSVQTGDTLQISVSGEGIALIQASLFYNLKPAARGKNSDDPFIIDTEYRASGTNQVIHTCIRLNPAGPIAAGSSGMVLVEVGLFSGYSPDVDSLSRVLVAHPTVKKYEIDPTNQRVVFYIEKLSPDDKLCFQFTAFATAHVEELQPVVSAVYDYYQPQYRASLITSFKDVQGEADSGAYPVVFSTTLLMLVFILGLL